MKIKKENIYISLMNDKKYEIIDNDSSFKRHSKNFKKGNKYYLKTKIIYVLLTLTFSLIIYKYLIHNPLFFNIKKYFIPNTYRIAFIFGTRPEAVKLFPLIKELKENKNYVCIIINTGQHKEMIQQILNSLHMESSIDFNLNLMKKNQSLAKLTSTVILELDKIYNLINPNAIIVQGDTTTAFSAALSAYYKKIPIFHVEAGLRTHNLYYPFPEEFNRLTIDDLSTLYFSPTNWSASNLLKEYKNASNIFVTGNTIVDSLLFTLKNTSPSKNIKSLFNKAKNLCIPSDECKIILLTCHRRENYFKPIYNIITAVVELLKNFNNIVVIFPFHLNPNVQQSIKNALPNIFYNKIINRKTINNKNFAYLNRFLMIPPLGYLDLIHLESESYFIMSDSGGIQEEAVSMGKPIIILRENTERPEGVQSGCAFLAGVSFKKIYYYASSLLQNYNLYQNISKKQYIYGNGNSSVIISNIIRNYFNNNLLYTDAFNLSNYKDILSQYDDSLMNKDNLIHLNTYKKEYDIVIVLTVWKRNNLERQLIQVKNQSILKNKRINVIIFQNSNHTYIEDIVNRWKNSSYFSGEVDITYIPSPIETGYFGRFLVPLTSSVSDDSYFFICDDDIIWGNRYFENMLRVVNEGFLCTRNGRIITKNFIETAEYGDSGLNKQVCFNEDIEYDFGGHIWAGRISWLRKAWNHIPFSIENSEDFWISAVLQTFYNISTKIPKCPCPEGKPIIPDMCAVSHMSGRKHEDAKLGNITIGFNIRSMTIRGIIEKFNYQRLVIRKPEYVRSIHKKYAYGTDFFNLTDDLWKDPFLWQ